MRTDGNVYSVGQISVYLQRMFRSDYLLHSVYVRGEVSNFKYHVPSGNLYFTLKDASGTLDCMMRVGKAKGGVSFGFQDGSDVIVHGTIGAYTRGSKYELYADEVTPAGAGALYQKYEELKEKLSEMGLFSEVYKKPIPKYIRRLGVVTASTGEAVRDIIHVSKRRNPYIEIILCPCLVQGDGAKESIVKAIETLDHLGDNDPEKKIDTIIVGRGGGSMEDLWAFNEEMVAQAVFDCNTPIISAVGHQGDVVITDYVADLRAATPSQAAELAVFEMKTVDDTLERDRERLEDLMQHRILDARRRCESYGRQLQALSPKEKLKSQRHEIQTAGEKLQRAMEDKLFFCRQQLEIERDLEDAMERKLRDRRQNLQLLAARLDALSPVRRLSGPYGYLETTDGRSIRSAKDIEEGQTLITQMRDGKITSLVQKRELSNE